MEFLCGHVEAESQNPQSIIWVRLVGPLVGFDPKVGLGLNKFASEHPR